MDFINYSDVLVLSIVLVSIAMILYKRRLPNNWPFFGMIPYTVVKAHHIHDSFTDVLKLSDATFLFKGPWFANMDTLITSDPTNVHHILSKNFTNYLKGREYQEIFECFGDGIFNSDQQLWEIHRKVTMSIFKNADFHTLIETTMKNKIDKALLPFLRFFKNQGIIDLQEIFLRFTFDTICSMLLDYDPESLSVELPINPCKKAFTDIEKALFWRHILPKSVWKLQQRFGMGKEKILSEAMKVLDKFIYKCLSRKEHGSMETKVWVLRSLMRGFEGHIGTCKDSKKFLKDMILNLMFAGRDTSGTTLSWFFYLLAKNPIVEYKIREEIQKLVDSSTTWRNLSAKELGGLVYLHGGLCETLRLYPPLPLEYKESSERDVLPSGHVVDPHKKIILSFYSMGRMEQIWGDDCNEFKPERWFSESGKGIKHEPSYKFTAFHAGPRTCLGKEMSFIQMKMVATAIIYHYHVELVEGHKVCPSDSLFLQMKYGLQVKLFPTN